MLPIIIICILWLLLLLVVIAIDQLETLNRFRTNLLRYNEYCIDNNEGYKCIPVPSSNKELKRMYFDFKAFCINFKIEAYFYERYTTNE